MRFVNLVFNREIFHFRFNAAEGEMSQKNRMFISKIPIIYYKVLDIYYLHFIQQNNRNDTIYKWASFYPIKKNRTADRNQLCDNLFKSKEAAN